LNVKNVCKNLCIPFGFIKSVKKAKAILRACAPDVVFSKGGFVALPVVRAARALKIPVVAHESDATIGLANKLSVGACDTVCATFARTVRDNAKSGKFVHTGSPIRSSIYAGDRGVVTTRHFGGGKETGAGGVTRANLLVIGGSLGAARINGAVVASRAKLCARYNVIHVCGKGKTGGAENNGAYVALEFVNDIENYLAWADIVVSRAGSNTLCELMVLGKPTLFIPLAAGRGDQIHNAAEVLRHDAAGVLYEKELTPAALIDGINDVWRKREHYAENSKNVVKDGTKEI
jgi:UDP-N-acetylglucosamine--N-acetylmuramyl-(pentapeptide) pyrophosphoryl-undecaprenol N-acetylglucosamine transferase